MFKLTGASGRRSANPGGGVAQAARRIISPFNKFHNTTQVPPHVAFQDPPGSGTHGFDSNTPRIDETA